MGAVAIRGGREDDVQEAMVIPLKYNKTPILLLVTPLNISNQKLQILYEIKHMENLSNDPRQFPILSEAQ